MLGLRARASRVVWAAGFGLILLSLISCKREEASVEVVRVRSASIQPALHLLGTFHADETEEVFSQVDGRVSQVLVAPGDMVQTGQILVEMEKRTIEVALAKAKDDAAKRSLAWAKEACDVRAPIPGRILWIHVRPGEIVGGEWGALEKKSLVTVIPEGAPLSLKGSLPADYASGLVEGARVSMELSKEIPPVEGKVKALRREGEEMEVTFEYPSVEGWQPEPEKIVKIDLLHERIESALVVPIGSVLERDGRWVVRVQKGRGEREVEVQLGVNDGDLVQVLSGLKEGDTVLRGSR